MFRRICGASVLVLAVLVSVPSIASADTTIGSITKPSGSSATSPAPQGTYLQLSSASFAAAVPAGGGRITQWSTSTAGSTAGATVQLVVLRPAGGTNFTITAVDTETLPNPLPVSGVATFTVVTPIPVAAGDKIGINSPTGNAVTFWQGGTTPSTDVIEIASTSSPSFPAPGETIQSFGTAPGARVNVSAFISQSADVGVTTSTAPARPSVGNLAVLGSTVTNHTPGSAPVTFTDTVPSGLSINSAFAGGNGSCSVSGQTVTCTIPNVPNGGAVPVNVLVTPSATGSYVNHVSVTPVGLADLNPSDNSASATLNVAKLATNACTVPNLKGASAKVAKRVLKQLGCKVKIKRKNGRGVPKGAVLKSKPKPGTYVLGRTVTLIVRK